MLNDSENGLIIVDFYKCLEQSRAFGIQCEFRVKVGAMIRINLTTKCRNRVRRRILA